MRNFLVPLRCGLPVAWKGFGWRPLFIAVCAAALLGGQIGSAKAEERALKLYSTNTKEHGVIVFRRGGDLVPAGLKKINYFLRDWRLGIATEIDPALLDLLFTVYREARSSGYIHINSAFRSETTNRSLRQRSSGVAKASQHVRGKAVDFFIPGVPLATLRAVGLKLQLGGVGYYPKSALPFVHLDTGPVRHWPRLNRQQLSAVFPDGGTVHVPSDASPLPGYAQAKADYELREEFRLVVSDESSVALRDASDR